MRRADASRRRGVAALAGIALLALLALAAAPRAHAQSAAAGERLFTEPAAPGKLSCSANACHGNLTTPQNRIVNGLQAAAIKAATGRVSQMRFLENVLGDAQYNDIAAYLAGKLGGTAGYLPVVAMPVPALAPATLNFGALDLLLNSPPQTVTLTNAANASAPLAIGAIATTAGSDFSVTGGSCKAGENLPVGASCTILVGFTPSTTGTRSGSLSVLHNGAAGSSTLALNGIGTGTSPVIALTPPSLGFSQTLGSTSADLRLLIGNTGSGALRLGAMTLGGAQAAEFALATAAGCAPDTVLLAGESCAVAVHFTPGGTGVRNAALTIAHNAQGGSSTVALAGWGNATPQPSLMLDAASLDLGEQVASTRSTERVLTVINNGQAPLQFTGLGLEGAQAGEFALGGSCAVGTPVAAQGTCTIAVSVTPADLGRRSATLRIAGNAPQGTAGVTVTTLGVNAPAPVVQLSQAALGFGTVGIGGRSAPRTTVLTNAGNAALTIASLTTSGPEFALTHDCPATLAPQASCALNVVYAPTSAVASEQLTIRSDARSSPNQVVLNGIGSSSALALLDWTEGGAPLAFASTQVGAASDAVLRTLVNRGPGDATLSTLTVAGSDGASFVLGGGTCRIGAVLAPQASCTVGLRFAPTALGPRSALLQVGTSGSNPPELALSGTAAGFAAVQLPMTAEPAALDYRGQALLTGGRSEPLTLRIVNGSSAASTLAQVTTSAGWLLVPAAGDDACPGVPWTLGPGTACRVAVVFAPINGGASKGTLAIVTSAGQTTEVALAGESQTVMTNVGGAASGGGALGAGWLLLLGTACAALRRHGRHERHDHGGTEA